jgi:hypothetical protein
MDTSREDTTRIIERMETGLVDFIADTMEPGRAWEEITLIPAPVIEAIAELRIMENGGDPWQLLETIMNLDLDRNGLVNRAAKQATAFLH